jgi:hypothetical protein
MIGRAATVAAKRAVIEHAKQRPGIPWFTQVCEVLGQEDVGIAPIAKETDLTRQAVYRIKADPTGSEAALAA